MDYNKTTWVSENTPVNATNMNNIEDGIENVDGKFGWSEITADPATATVNRGYLCDTSGGAFTITLPAGGVVGEFIRVVDVTGSFGTENLTIQANAADIFMGNATPNNYLVLSANFDFLTIVYSGTNGWVITSKP